MPLIICYYFLDRVLSRVYTLNRISKEVVEGVHKNKGDKQMYLKEKLKLARRVAHMENKTCKDLVKQALAGRIKDLETLFDLWQSGDEEGDSKLGTFNEYGLAFDYVAPGIFKDQKRGYFRYQISYGGPSEEFRFYTDENLSPTRIEFWYLDWFDGAKVILKNKAYALMQEIFEDFKETGTVQHMFEKATL